MKTKFSFMDPGAIMGVVVALIILGVGIFAVLYTLQAIEAQAPSAGLDYTEASNASNASRWQFLDSVANRTSDSETVTNIIGIVLVIGAIMSIVGLVYNYVR